MNNKMGCFLIAIVLICIVAISAFDGVRVAGAVVVQSPATSMLPTAVVNVP